MTCWARLSSRERLSSVGEPGNVRQLDMMTEPDIREGSTSRHVKKGKLVQMTFLAHLKHCYFFGMKIVSNQFVSFCFFDESFPIPCHLKCILGLCGLYPCKHPSSTALIHIYYTRFSLIKQGCLWMNLFNFIFNYFHDVKLIVKLPMKNVNIWEFLIRGRGLSGNSRSNSHSR